MGYATNEWDQLRKLIVGTANCAKIPQIDSSMRLVNYADVDNIKDIPSGKYPAEVVSEANTDLEIFVNFLEGEGIEVLRPSTHKDPNPKNVSYYDYCPRDIMFVHGKHAIATPNPIRARAFNYRTIAQHFPRIEVAPRYYEENLYNTECLGNPDVLALNEVAPAFDAANIIRANDDLLYLVSNSGNKAGAQWLQEHTGLRVHTLEGVYSYMHIDSTIAFLREGLMLLNPSRIKDINVLPDAFKDWDYIMCPEPNEIGYYGNYNNASPWINMNLISINPNLVCIEENQVNLAKELEKHGIESMMLPTRHQRTLGGGFHCVTLDLERG